MFSTRKALIVMMVVVLLLFINPTTSAVLKKQKVNKDSCAYDSDCFSGNCDNRRCAQGSKRFQESCKFKQQCASNKCDCIGSGRCRDKDKVCLR